MLPLFFILVAVLVCMTTMTRMVDERRGQIGILKGLGYSRRDIMVTFLAYSGIAAALGCVVGYALGVILFPSGHLVCLRDDVYCHSDALHDQLEAGHLRLPRLHDLHPGDHVHVVPE